jgi:hypothetical protein
MGRKGKWSGERERDKKKERGGEKKERAERRT